MSGVSGRGDFERFIARCVRWVREDGVDVVLGQEHNTPPGREEDMRRLALLKGFTLLMSHDVAGRDGVHHGGTLVLLNNRTIEWPLSKTEREKRVLHREAGALVVNVPWAGRDMHVGSVYAPSPPSERVAFLKDMREWVTEDMFLGGDWNCVPDVTLDVQSSNPMRYKNVGASLLGTTMAEVGLWDFRRTQLGNEHEGTRQPLGMVHTRDGPDVVVTRLDRFYIPTTEAFEDLLPSLRVQWDVVWSDEARDHAAIVMDLENAVGELGHERPTIREDLAKEPGVQDQIIKVVDEAYGKGGSETAKWERGERAMRDHSLGLQLRGGLRRGKRYEVSVA